MDIAGLLAYLRDRILELGIKGVDRTVFDLGNQAFRPYGKGVWFRLRAESESTDEPQSEEWERERVTVSITMTFPPGTGTERESTAAAAAAGLFLPFDPVKGAFQVGDTRYYLLENRVEKVFDSANGSGTRLSLKMTALKKRNV